MSKLPALLLHLRRSHGDGVATRNDFDLYGLKLKFKDLCLLSDDLFKLLHVKFELFFSVLRELSESRSPRVPELHSKLWKIVENLKLVLRSCLIILTLLESEQQSLLKKCRYICQILKIFRSIDVNGRNGRTQITFENLASCEFSASSAEHSISVSFELRDRCRPFLCSVLEAFADECLKHPSLRKYIMYVESSYSISEKDSTFHLNHGYIASVLEIVSAHFMLSVSDEQALENFISRLLLPCGKDSRDFELSLEASMSLLLNPIMLSAPKLFQAHVISLVSEAIGSGLPSQNLVSDSLMDCYLAAFERSIILYTMHASSLQTDDDSCIGFKCSDHPYLLGRSQIMFETYVQQVTKNKLDYLVSKLDGSWDSYHCKMSSKTEASLLTECITFMKESQHMLPDSCKNSILSILECITCRTFSENAAGDEFYTRRSTSAQDICLLTSILKLMSISLIQATRCLSSSGNSSCVKTLENASVSKRYDFLISIVSCFQLCNICLPIQKLLSDVMKSHRARHKHSKSILFHFSGLLSSSFIHGLDILAKACVSVIMALMYLFIFEEGDLIAFESLNDLPLQSSPSEMPLAKARKAAGNKTSYRVASEFHKIWARYSRMNSLSSCQQGIQDNEEISMVVPILNPFSYDLEEETCNGEMFLECISEKSRRSDYADLVDFIECKRGKDYNAWLKNREKYRRWKQNKVDNMRKKGKKMLWKVLNGSRTSSSKVKMKRQKQ